MKHLIRYIAIGGFWLFLGQQLLLSQQIRESFDYPTNSYLHGQGEAKEGWGGPWLHVMGDSIRISSQSINLPGGSFAGNHSHLNFQSSGIRYDRQLYDRFEDDGLPLWLSYYVHFPSEGSNNNVGMLDLMDGDEKVLSIGRMYGNNRFGFHWPPNVFQYVSNVPSEDSIHWIVVRIDFSGNPEQENAYLWIDPEPTTLPSTILADLSVPKSNLPQFFANNGFNKLRLKAEGAASLDMRIDEIRIGKSYEAVSPTYLPPTPGNFLVRESFEYPVNTYIASASSTGIGFASDWFRTVGDSAFVVEGSLLFEGLESEVAGNQLFLDFQQAGMRYDRLLEQSVLDDGGEVWMSMIMDFPVGDPLNNVGNFTLLKDGTKVLSFGKMFGTGQWGFHWLPNVFQYQVPLSHEGLHWVVAKIQFSGDSEGEEAWLWVDPNPFELPRLDSATLAVPETGLPNLTINEGFNGIRVKAEGTPPLRMSIDEIRMGRSFEDVAPFLPSYSPKSISSHISYGPNPFFESFELRLQQDGYQHLFIRLFDVGGRLIWEEKLNPQSGEFFWSIKENQQSLRAGNYFLDLQRGNERQILKITKK